MIPFVVTLATMTVVSGASIWLTNSLNIPQLPDGFVEFFDARPLFGVPVTVLIVAALAAIIAMLMRSSVVGRWATRSGSMSGRRELPAFRSGASFSRATCFRV